MPRGDRTGPAGAGPMTGRGAGLCAGYPAAGALNPGTSGGGRGWGGGGRGGRGDGGRRHRHWVHANGLTGWQRAALAGEGDVLPPRASSGPPMTPEQELEVLKRQARSLEQTLEELRGRIGRIETAAESSKSK